jgi:magnesium transporter
MSFGGLNETLEQMFTSTSSTARGGLVGVLSMRDLILARPDRKIADIMRRNVRRRPRDDGSGRRRAADPQVQVHGRPVTDKQSRLLGLITVDDVVDVIQEEATEDVRRWPAPGCGRALDQPVAFFVQEAIWWLEVNLLTAFMAAAVIAIFQDTIKQLAILAAYQTIVSGMGGNARRRRWPSPSAASRWARSTARCSSASSTASSSSACSAAS